MKYFVVDGYDLYKIFMITKTFLKMSFFSELQNNMSHI